MGSESTDPPRSGTTRFADYSLNDTTSDLEKALTSEKELGKARIIAVCFTALALILAREVVEVTRSGTVEAGQSAAAPSGEEVEHDKVFADPRRAAHPSWLGPAVERAKSCELKDLAKWNPESWTRLKEFRGWLARQSDGSLERLAERNPTLPGLAELVEVLREDENRWLLLSLNPIHTMMNMTRSEHAVVAKNTLLLEALSEYVEERLSMMDPEGEHVKTLLQVPALQEKGAQYPDANTGRNTPTKKDCFLQKLSSLAERNVEVEPGRHEFSISLESDEDSYTVIVSKKKICFTGPRDSLSGRATMEWRMDWFDDGIWDWHFDMCFPPEWISADELGASLMRVWYDKFVRSDSEFEDQLGNLRAVHISYDSVNHLSRLILLRTAGKDDDNSAVLARSLRISREKILTTIPNEGFIFKLFVRLQDSLGIFPAPLHEDKNERGKAMARLLNEDPQFPVSEGLYTVYRIVNFGEEKTSPRFQMPIHLL